MPVSSLALRACALFAQAPDSVLEQASERMEIVHLKRREVLLSGNRPFSGLGLVLQGRVQAIDHTIDGREVALTTIEAGGVFGHANLMAPRPIELTWMAITPSTLAVMAPDDAMALFQHGQMSLHVDTDMAQQVCDFLGWQKILSVHPVGARLCTWLLWHSSGAELVSLHTHAELAWRLNTTRESVTRILQRLQADGILRREGELWRVVSRERLQELAQGDTKVAE